MATLSPSSPSSSSSSVAESETDGWRSDSSSSSSFSDDELTDAFASGDDPVARRSSAERSPLRLRGRHGRHASVTDSGDHSARAYGEALRTVRASSHRASISIAPGTSFGTTQLTEDTKRRHRESKKRMQCADLTQRLLFRAQEINVFMNSVPLWLHASVVPPRWRVQITDHLTAIHAQMQFCCGRVVAAWHLLLPPFDKANLREYETRLALLERSVAHLDAAIQQCQVHVVDGERASACTFLQVWYRRCLARRRFYTKTVHVHSRQSRGLIPGLFDTIAATSRLTVHPGTPKQSMLEYPTSPAVAKHAFLS